MFKSKIYFEQYGIFKILKDNLYVVSYIKNNDYNNNFNIRYLTEKKLLYLDKNNIRWGLICKLNSAKPIELFLK